MDDKTKHSARSWQIQNADSNGISIFAPNRHQTLICRVFAKTHNGLSYIEHEEARANAHLIEHAPDLLFCLKDILARFQSAVAAGGKVEGDDIAIRNALDIIRGAEATHV